ncbi:MAG: hypothetical protein HXX08_01200 [Chloroflexi bacterium]|uniref:Uncharacterized protein n=1 Tax=Candidatus Chlorohelix allophototropha TaxID=3003348 RepID=A0A8T7LWA2_9CHLR|nr:hypothetical protein [Chloroflexota bacterium]WJW66365.1 hypothetical protein OZ401_002161 [Chloroflexota bacterium L227-S17]
MTVSFLWLIVTILIGVFTVRGYARGSYREFVWSFALVVTAFIVPGVLDILIGIINVIAQFISDRVNAVAKGTGAFQIKLDNNFKTGLQTVLFLLLVGFAYLYGRKRPLPVPGKPNKFRPPSDKSLLGALVGFFNGLFFLNYIYSNITKILGKDLRLTFLDNVKIAVPQIGGNGAPQIGGGEIKLRETGERFPLLAWLDYLPLIMGGFLLFYLIFVVFFNPPTNKEGGIDFVRLFLGLAGATLILLIGVNVFLRK